MGEIILLLKRKWLSVTGGGGNPKGLLGAVEGYNPLWNWVHFINWTILHKNGNELLVFCLLFLENWRFLQRSTSLSPFPTIYWAPTMYPMYHRASVTLLLGWKSESHVCTPYIHVWEHFENSPADVCYKSLFYFQMSCGLGSKRLGECGRCSSELLPCCWQLTRHSLVPSNTCI